MNLRITRRAQNDLESLFAYIAADNPFAAQRVIERILAALERLRGHPGLGHAGRVSGTRELVVRHTPYIAVFLARPDEIVIVRIRHGSRAWPPAR